MDPTPARPPNRQDSAPTQIDLPSERNPPAPRGPAAPVARIPEPVRPAAWGSHLVLGAGVTLLVVGLLVFVAGTRLAPSVLPRSLTPSRSPASERTRPTAIPSVSGQPADAERGQDAGRSGDVLPSAPLVRTPAGSVATGTLQITGLVQTPLTLDAPALAIRLATQLQSAFQTGNGTREAHEETGPLLRDLLREAGAQGNGGRDLPIRYLVVSGEAGRQVIVSWGEIDPIFAGTRELVVWREDGAAFRGRQGPARLVLPSDRTAARSLYGLTRIEVRAVPPVAASDAVLQVTGLVAQPLRLTAEDLAARHPAQMRVTYMAGGQMITSVYKGVPLWQLLTEAGVRPGGANGNLTKFVVATGSDGRQAVLSWGEIDPTLAGVNVLVAYEADGQQLTGGRARLIVPSDARGGRYVPDLTSLDVRDAGQ